MKHSIILLPLCILAACGSKQTGTDVVDSTKKAAARDSWTAIHPDTQAMKSLTRVEIQTSMGNLTVALFNSTPRHRDNFLKLARNGFYNGTLFHRIIRNFMIQAGDPASKTAKPGQMLGDGGPGYEIPAEFVDTLYHYRGALAAAREGDERNPEKKSSGSQFYIVQGDKVSTDQLTKMVKSSLLMKLIRDPDNLSYSMRMEAYKKRGDAAAMNLLQAELEGKVGPAADSMINAMPRRVKQMYATWGGAPFLDREYTVFGFLISGYDVLDKLQAVQTAAEDRPVQDIRITGMKVLD